MFVAYCCIVFVVAYGDMRCLSSIVVLVLLYRVGIYDVYRVVFDVTCRDMRCLSRIVVLCLLSRMGI